MAAASRGGLQLTPYYAPMERLHLMLARGELDAIATTSVQSGVPAFYSDAYIEYHNVAVALASRHLPITCIADMAGYSMSTYQRARLYTPRIAAMLSTPTRLAAVPGHTPDSTRAWYSRASSALVWVAMS